MQEDFKTIGAWFKCTTIVITLFLLTACANLESVRDFAKHSASLTCGTEVIDYWGKWDERSERFDAVRDFRTKNIPFFSNQWYTIFRI